MPTTHDSQDITQSSVHLDAVRGAAAVVVLFGHTRNLFFSSITGDQRDDVPGPARTNAVGVKPVNHVPKITIGNEAVMIFFVLSGYLVGGSALKALKRNRWSWKNYLVKRMTRLWVVLLPALLLGVAVDYAGLHFFPSPTAIYATPLVSDQLPVRLSLPVVAANAVFLQKIATDTAGTNESLWSLTNEFWYYIAFPLLLLALSGSQKPGWRVLYVFLFAGIALLVGPQIRLLFFIWVLGAILSILPLKVPYRTATLISGILAVLLPVLFVLIRRARMPQYAAEWAVALLFTFALYLVLHQTETARPGLYRSTSSFFSRISYTLYLVHLPLAVFLCACINSPWHQWSKSSGNLLKFLGFNAVLIVLSYLFYLVFEANTDKVRNALFHREMKERHLPAAQ